MESTVVAGICASKNLNKAVKALTVVRKQIMRKINKISSKKYKLKFVDFRGLSFEKIKKIIVTEFANFDFDSLKTDGTYKKNLKSLLKNWFREDIQDDILKIGKANPRKYERENEKYILSMHFYMIFSYFYFESLANDIFNFIESKKKVLKQIEFKFSGTNEEIRIANMFSIFKNSITIDFSFFKTKDLETFLKEAFDFFKKGKDIPLSNLIKQPIEKLKERIQRSYINALKTSRDKIKVNLKEFENIIEPDLEFKLKTA